MKNEDRPFFVILPDDFPRGLLDALIAGSRHARQHAASRTHASTPPPAPVKPRTDRSIDPDHVARPHVIAIGGLPGSGKTTVGVELATQLKAAAVLVDMDRVWSETLGLKSTDRVHPDQMENRLVEQVGRRMEDEIRMGLRKGGIVVVASPFFDPGMRMLTERVAVEEGGAFSGIWLMAPTETTSQRAKVRQQRYGAGSPEKHNPSVADSYDDLNPIHFQARVEPHWTRVDSTRPLQDVVVQVWDAVCDQVRPENKMDFESRRPDIGGSRPIFGDISRRWWQP